MKVLISFPRWMMGSDSLARNVERIEGCVCRSDEYLRQVGSCTYQLERLVLGDTICLDRALRFARSFYADGFDYNLEIRA